MIEKLDKDRNPTFTKPAATDKKPSKPSQIIPAKSEHEKEVDQVEETHSFNEDDDDEAEEEVKQDQEDGQEAAAAAAEEEEEEEEDTPKLVNKFKPPVKKPILKKQQLKKEDIFDLDVEEDEQDNNLNGSFEQMNVSVVNSQTSRQTSASQQQQQQQSVKQKPVKKGGPFKSEVANVNE